MGEQDHEREFDPVERFSLLDDVTRDSGLLEEAAVDSVERELMLGELMQQQQQQQMTAH